MRLDKTRSQSPIEAGPVRRYVGWQRAMKNGQVLVDALIRDLRGVGAADEARAVLSSSDSRQDAAECRFREAALSGPCSGAVVSEQVPQTS